MPENNCFAVPPQPGKELLAAIGKNPFPGAGSEDELQKILAHHRRETADKPVIYVGTGTCGLGAGAGKTLEAIRAYLKARHTDAEVVEVGCIGICSEEPLMDVQLPGKPRVSFRRVTERDVPEILDSAFAGKYMPERTLGYFGAGGAIDGLSEFAGLPEIGAHPFFAGQIRWVLANCGLINPVSIEEYISRGGFTQLARVLLGFTPDQVCDQVERSGLKGRGGGGFLAGKKWKLSNLKASEEKYLICNADEGDPGAFMDRAVIESDTYRLIEGMAIAAYALRAHKAYVYIRAEYPLAIERLKTALARCLEFGLLGENILGLGFNLDIVIKKGAGAFVCGEETALMHSIEGKRGMPRPRPPYPSESGLWEKPTVINNVETLANVPDVFRLGPEGFAAVGTTGSKGTKVFALSGAVSRTGLVEVPMGTTIRRIVEEIGGGVAGGKRVKAVQMGGPAGGCVPEQHLDVEIDFESLKAYGAIMGSGGMVVMNENTCMVDLAAYFMEFIQNESCGKCIPCRLGTKQVLDILKSITRSRREETEIDALLRMQGVVYLERLAATIKEISLCGLGQNATNPVLSTLRWFRDEYEAHIFERTCPAGVCRSLSGVPCQRNCPVGTEVWRYVAEIANGDFEEAYRVIRKANPLPSVCARVCHHPCETNCRSGSTGGEPIAVRALKRFVVDRVKPEALHRPVVKAAVGAQRAAVIGAGPSGLTAAHCLSTDGVRVTVFEKEKTAGGMLVAAIPEYRMPRDTLAREIGELLNENIEIVFGKELGKDFTIENLFKDGFTAVYLAVGSHKNQKLGIKGEEAAGVMAGINFLKDYNLHGTETARGRVGIIGGGNSAIDAARVAVRQKAVTEVTVYYRRTRNEMPAYAEEIEAALEEGVRIVPLMAPIAIKAEKGKLASVTFVKNRLDARDASGRQKPVAIPGSETEAALDTLIVAISEQPDTEKLDGVKTEKWGGIVVDPETMLTSARGVFAGGDAVSGPNTVIEAIAAGKKAARLVYRYLTGKGLVVFEDVALPETYVAPPDTNGDSPKEVARVRIPRLVPARRAKNFCEVELCLAEGDAIAEARRCLRCDLEFTAAGK
ncbi:MAG: FAD-dependent oxidoreductase [Spirochaetales bacterium]|nr:FAD-dependent oxidoreductase [Spirochaetales bacterium]